MEIIKTKFSTVLVDRKDWRNPITGEVEHLIMQCETFSPNTLESIKYITGIDESANINKNLNQGLKKLESDKIWCSLLNISKNNKRITLQELFKIVKSGRYFVIGSLQTFYRVFNAFNLKFKDTDILNNPIDKVATINISSDITLDLLRYDYADVDTMIFSKVNDYKDARFVKTY